MKLKVEKGTKRNWNQIGFVEREKSNGKKTRMRELTNFNETIAWEPI
jgi:hypothetical protein